MLYFLASRGFKAPFKEERHGGISYAFNAHMDLIQNSLKLEMWWCFIVLE